MESESSLPHSQEPATCPYPELQRFSPCPHPISQKSILILSSHLRLGLPSGFLPSGFPNKSLYAPLKETKNNKLNDTLPLTLLSFFVSHIRTDSSNQLSESRHILLLHSTVPVQSDVSTAQFE